MDDDDMSRPMSIDERLARLWAILELVDVYLTIGTFTEADQKALQKRVGSALEAEQAQRRRGPFT